MTDAFEYDPERALWKPGRRAFFFGLGAALVAPMLPDLREDMVQYTIAPYVVIGETWRPLPNSHGYRVTKIEMVGPFDLRTHPVTL